MAKKNIHVDKDIKILNLDNAISRKLMDFGIETVGNLWEMNRKKLKSIGLKDSEIKQIQIKLQLLGLDLNKKVYS